jgi:hypothetical protein
MGGIEAGGESRRRFEGSWWLDELGQPYSEDVAVGTSGVESITFVRAETPVRRRPSIDHDLSLSGSPEPASEDRIHRAMYGSAECPAPCGGSHEPGPETQAHRAIAESVS